MLFCGTGAFAGVCISLRLFEQYLYTQDMRRIRVAGRHQRELAALREELDKAVKGQSSSAEDALTSTAAKGDTDASGDTSTVDEEVGPLTHAINAVLLLTCN